MSVVKINAVLNVTGVIVDVCLCRSVKNVRVVNVFRQKFAVRIARNRRIKSDVDLIGMKIAADGQQAPVCRKIYKVVRYCDAAAFLQARIVLVNFVAVNRIGKKNVKFENKSNSERPTNASALNVAPDFHSLR